MKIIFISNSNNDITLTNAQLDLIKDLRAKWAEHNWLLRAYMISDVNDLDDLEYITQTFYDDAEYAELFDRIYGIEKTSGMKELTEEHISLEIQLIDQLKRGDTLAAEETRVQRYQQAEDMAEFLSGINPFLDKDELQSLITEHVDLTEEQIKLYTEGRFDSQNYAAELELFEEVKEQGYEIADYITAGIITQFGDKL